MGDEGVCHRSYSWLSRRADLGVGVRSDAGGNQALGRSRAARIEDVQAWE